MQHATGNPYHVSGIYKRLFASAEKIGLSLECHEERVRVSVQVLWILSVSFYRYQSNLPSVYLSVVDSQRQVKSLDGNTASASKVIITEPSLEVCPRDVLQDSEHGLGEINLRVDDTAQIIQADFSFRRKDAKELLLLSRGYATGRYAFSRRNFR